MATVSIDQLKTFESKILLLLEENEKLNNLL